jgi:hypothetical protein
MLLTTVLVVAVLALLAGIVRVLQRPARQI